MYLSNHALITIKTAKELNTRQPFNLATKNSIIAVDWTFEVLSEDSKNESKTVF